MGGITEEVGGVTIGRNYHTSPSSGQEDAFRHKVDHGKLQVDDRNIVKAMKKTPKT